MPSTMVSLVTDPNSFFRDRRDDPSFLGPVLVITLIALLGLVSSIVQIRATAEILNQVFAEMDLPQGFQTASQAFQIAGALVGFVLTYVIWAVWAGIFYGATAIFDGSGRFTTTLKLVGWGFVPSLVGSLFNVVITVYRFEIRGFNPPPSGAGPQAAQQFAQQLSSGPLVVLSAVLGFVFTLWAGVLWTFAVKHARQVETKYAAVAAALPVLIGLGGSTWGLINAL